MQQLKLRARHEHKASSSHRHEDHDRRRRRDDEEEDDRRRRHRPDDEGNRQRGERERRDDNRDWRKREIKREPESGDERGRKSFRPNNDEGFWSKDRKDGDKKPDEEENKAKPNFALSGKLAEDTNTFNGIVISYNEPPEAKKPKRKWRLYPFKGEEALPFIPIHQQSAYLLGRERKIADIPIDHPSCSKQHAVIQFRVIEFEREDGTIGKRVRPYAIDLESSNGTFVNNQKIESRRYYELFEKDVIKFGYSSREYVVLHEESKEEGEDDDIAETSTQEEKEKS